jgi:hypothetical protein
LIFADEHRCKSALEECSAIDNEIISLKEQYNCDTVISLGDNFDLIQPGSQVLTQFAQFVKKLNCNFICLAAQSHESETLEDSILNHFEILDNNIKIVKEFIDGTHIYCGHFIVKEAKKNFGATISKESLKQYKYVFLGHCVSEDTEILTLEGWKKYNELKIGEKVATLNINKNKIEYQPLLNIHKYDYNDKMINFKSRAIDILVTPNHSIVVSNKKFRKQAEIKLAYQIDYDNILMNVSNWDYPVDYSFEKKELAKLIGWIIGDGSLVKTKRGILYGIRLYQKVGYKSRLIKKLLIKLNLKYTIHLQKKISMNTFYLGKDNKLLLSIINELCPDKILNRKLINLPKKQLQLLFEGLILSDGCHQEGNLDTFYQKDLKEILIFEELCLRLGKRFYTRLGNSGFKPSSINYEVAVSNSRIAHISKNQGNINIIKYNDVVWCPEVTNGTWIAKRNGHHFITGNSHSHEIIKSNTCQLGSCRWVNFDESEDKQKVVAIITNYGEKEERVNFISLKSPIPMIELHLQEKIDKNAISDPQNVQNESKKERKMKSKGESASNPSTTMGISELIAFLDKLDPRTKVKVKVLDFESFQGLLPLVNRYTYKFEIFKYENKYEINIVPTENKEEKEILKFKEAFTKWLAEQKVNDQIKNILLGVIK